LHCDRITGNPAKRSEKTSSKQVAIDRTLWFEGM